MTVASILNVKGRKVFTESTSRTLGEICKYLGERRVGAVVLCEKDQEISGIISERDVVGAIANHGKSALEKPVTDFMTKEVMVCSEADTITTVMARMTEGRFRHLPVVEGGKLCGLISIGDVVKYRIAQVEKEAEEMRTYIHTT